MRAKYAYLRRPVIEQRLALPAEAVRALYAMLEENALPENRAYRYDFFFDNCSTRLLVALDLLGEFVGVGGRVEEVVELAPRKANDEERLPEVEGAEVVRPVEAEGRIVDAEGTVAEAAVDLLAGEHGEEGGRRRVRQTGRRLRERGDGRQEEEQKEGSTHGARR